MSKKQIPALILFIVLALGPTIIARAGAKTSLPDYARTAPSAKAIAPKKKIFIPLVSSATVQCVPTNTKREQAKVIRVIDGDDIEVDLNGVLFDVRYIGSDSPDLPDEYFHAETVVKNQQLVGGKQVTLVKDITEKDYTGRLRRYVFVDGLFVNLEMIHSGNARTEEIPPDLACAAVFQLVEKGAEERLAGMWAGTAYSLSSAQPAPKALRSASFITSSGAGRPVHISKPIAPW